MKSVTTLITNRLPFILTGLALCVSAAQGAGVNSRNADLVPTGKGYGVAAPESPATGNAAPTLLDDSELSGNPSTYATNGIGYHGGPVMTGTTHIYYIWYGNWANNTAPAILNNFANKIGGSPYYNINTTYYNASNVKISNSVTHPSNTSVAYPYGTALSDAQIQSVVSNAITTAALPNDPKGVYFVLTSKDVTATSGFCTNYCGWHTYTNISGKNIKYAFVGDPSQKCPTACEAQSVSPNNNPGADGMASVIAHELEEAATDPNLNAWYDSLGWENADKCAWKFGPTTTLANGSKYNMILGTKKYLIQQNWVNASGGYCALTF